MSIDKDYWKKLTFVKGDFPFLLCPKCGKGQLKANNKNSLQTDEIHETKMGSKTEWWEPDMSNYRFTLLLVCSKDSCLESTVCLGTGGLDRIITYDNFGDFEEEFYRPYYEPIYFLPALNIIPLKEKYPKELKLQLANSFSHFFSDLPSCANKIRVCIEILMDLLNVRKTEIKSRKRKNLTLHARIIEYKKKNSEIADYFLAIKWIGNSGSHYETLTRDDILEAYSILEYSLNKIYDNQEKAIQQLSKEINKKKAPRSKQKKKSST